MGGVGGVRWGIEEGGDNGKVDGSDDMLEGLVEGVKGRDKMKVVRGRGGRGDEVDRWGRDREGFENMEREFDVLEG